MISEYNRQLSDEANAPYWRIEATLYGRALAKQAIWEDYLGLLWVFFMRI